MEKKNYSPSEGVRSNGLVTQISVFLENRPGTLREATSILSEAGINLRALNIAETSDYGVLRLITEDPERTAQVLREQGFLAARTTVLELQVPDEPGGLDRVLRVIAENGFDIEYMYSIMVSQGGSAGMIFRVREPEKLWEILKEAENG
ncbi:MAG: ACT domain-containing protein [Lachnospiraceae bacterium]|nr:ACT domain-containing protein [Lachnospiraceae bacterium]